MKDFITCVIIVTLMAVTFGFLFHLMNFFALVVAPFIILVEVAIIMGIHDKLDEIKFNKRFPL